MHREIKFSRGFGGSGRVQHNITGRRFESDVAHHVVFNYKKFFRVVFGKVFGGRCGKIVALMANPIPATMKLYHSGDDFSLLTGQDHFLIIPH